MQANPLIPAISLILLLAALSSSIAAQQGTGVPAPPPETPQLASLPASVLNAELRATSGDSFRLSDYSGKVIVVNLWATWVGPSRLEIPALVTLHKEFRSHGVEMIGLSTEDPEASADHTLRFVRDFRVSYRIGWATSDVAETLLQGRDAIPQTYIVSRTGRIVRRFIGFDPAKTPAQFKNAIQEALDEKPDLPEQD